MQQAEWADTRKTGGSTDAAIRAAQQEVRNQGLAALYHNHTSTPIFLIKAVQKLADIQTTLTRLARECERRQAARQRLVVSVD